MHSAKRLKLKLIFFIRHAATQYACMVAKSSAILMKRAELEKFRKCIYLEERITHFRHKS